LTFFVPSDLLLRMLSFDKNSQRKTSTFVPDPECKTKKIFFPYHLSMTAKTRLLWRMHAHPCSSLSFVINNRCLTGVMTAILDAAPNELSL